MSPSTINLVRSSSKLPDIFFFTILSKLETSQQIFIEIPNIKFQVNPSGGSSVDTFR
jgi:hypothetical protein